MEGFILIAIIGVLVLYRMLTTRGIRSISIQQLGKEINDTDKVFIDVRTPEEFGEKYVQNFTNLPLGSDYSKLPRDKEIVVISQNGKRSIQVCKELKALGYEKVTNVRTGIGKR